MNAPVPRAQIERLVPHAGAMCLWHEVVAWDAQSIDCRTQGHRDPAHPLRRNGRLAAVHLAEYGAQAMAIHGGLLAGAAEPRLLTALRDVELLVERIDDLEGELHGHAQPLLAMAGGSIYQFEIFCGGRRLAQGRVTAQSA